MSRLSEHSVSWRVNKLICGAVASGVGFRSGRNKQTGRFWALFHGEHETPSKGWGDTLDEAVEDAWTRWGMLMNTAKWNDVIFVDVEAALADGDHCLIVGAHAKGCKGFWAKIFDRKDLDEPSFGKEKVYGVGWFAAGHGMTLEEAIKKAYLVKFNPGYINAESSKRYRDD